jgi:Fe2+ or Zn2+ uptake regulation protein
MSIIKEDLIFGRIAVLNNIISQEQMDEALAIQKNSDVPRLLSMILLEKGYISRLQFKAILETQKKRLPKPAITLQEKREDIAFAYLAVKYRYVDAETIYSCLQQQTELVKKGLLFRLSELLVNHRQLTVETAEHIIALQENRIMECPRCNTRYNTVGMQPDSEFTCKKCELTLHVPCQTGDENEAEAIEEFRQAIEAIAERQRGHAEEKPKFPAAFSKKEATAGMALYGSDASAETALSTDMATNRATSVLPAQTGDAAVDSAVPAPTVVTAKEECIDSQSPDFAPDESAEETKQGDYIDLESAEEVQDEQEKSATADEHYMALDEKSDQTGMPHGNDEDAYTPLPDHNEKNTEEYIHAFGVDAASQQRDADKNKNKEEYLALDSSAKKNNASPPKQ